MRKGNKLFVKWIIMYKKTALLCSVNISKNMEIIHRKILITNNLNYFCLMKKISIEQMENVNGGNQWFNGLACAGTITGMAVLFKPAATAGVVLSIWKASKWTSRVAGAAWGIGYSCGNFIAGLR